MIEIFTFAQGTPEWKAVRLGIPTASEFHSILAKGQGKTRSKYMLELIGEQLTGESFGNFSNEHTDRGHLLEPEARDLYSFDVAESVLQVGFIRRVFAGQYVGCSPDSLIGGDGMLEIKTKLPHLQIAAMRRDDIPPEHVAQCQGALWVSGRKWLDFVSYWPGMPLVVRRVFPDPEYVATLEESMLVFFMEMSDIKASLPKNPTLRLPKKTLQINAETEFTSLE